MVFYHKTAASLRGRCKRQAALWRNEAGRRLYDSMHGMVMSLEPNPACRDYCQSPEAAAISGAVPLAAGLILQYQKSPVRGRRAAGDGSAGHSAQGDRLGEPEAVAVTERNATAFYGTA